MIVIVPLTNYNLNENLIERAYAAWRIKRLLNETDFRNSFKYFVARQGTDVLEIYCIKAIAPFIGNPQEDRVKFLLEPVSDKCFELIREIILNIIANAPDFILSQNRKYILEEYLTQNGYHIPIECDCGIDNIKVLEPENDAFIEQSYQHTGPRNL